MSDANGYFYYRNGKLRYVDNYHEYTVTKEQISRFRSVVDSNPGKWKKGKVNEQIIDNHIFFFLYNEYEDDPMRNLYSILRYKEAENER